MPIFLTESRKWQTRKIKTFIFSLQLLTAEEVRPPGLEPGTN